MVQNKRTKTSYYMKIADLSYNSDLAFRKSVNKKLNKLLKEVNFYPNGELYISIDMNIKEALYKKFNSLTALKEIFKTNQDCIEFLEELIWRGEPVSPFDITSQVYKCRDGWYKCKNTGKEFNILTGTLFQNTKIPLPIWFEIIFREHSDKRGLPGALLMREYGFSSATAWHMLHKIRNAMGKENHQQLSGTVEVDEYHSGGIHKNMHLNKKIMAKNAPNQGKRLLQGFVERGGNLVIRTIPNQDDDTLNGGVLRYITPNSTVYTDENPSYKKLPPIYQRGSVNHSKKNYVDKNNNDIHTNTIENCWSNWRRVESTHIKISSKHLQNYANETSFRYNTRAMKNSGDACIWFLQNIQGTNITWREIRNAEYTRYNRNQARIA